MVTIFPGMLHGLIAGAITAPIVALILFLTSNIGKYLRGNSDLLSSIGAYVLSTLGLFMPCIVIGAILGMLIGFSLIWFPKGLKPWKAVLVGMLVPFIPTFWLIPFIIDIFFGYDRWSSPSQYQLPFLLLATYIACGCVGWSVNNKVLAYLKQRVAIPLEVNAKIVEYIWQAQKKWQASRFEIDKELIAQGYNSIEIDNAWRFIGNGRIFQDENGDLMLQVVH